MKKKIILFISLVILFLLGSQRTLAQDDCPLASRGDANCDFTVDGIDFTIWLNNYNQTTDQGPLVGDFNSDNIVDGIDFTLWLLNYNVSITPTPTPTPTLTPTPSPTNTPSPTPTPIPIDYPGELIDLTNWKLILPLGTPGDPDEIYQPQLDTFEDSPWFVLTSQNDSIQFRAPVNGASTADSAYPRSELTEMTDEGSTLAGWSSTSGSHSMFMDIAVTKTTRVRKHIIVGHVYNSTDEIIAVKLEDTRLIVEADGIEVAELNANYTLGDRFTIEINVQGGQTQVVYNGNVAYSLDQDYSDAYFRAGAYLQTNCDIEGSAVCNTSNYGEVLIYGLTVAHN